MAHITVKAKFIGTHGSLGYEANKEYNLVFRTSSLGIYVSDADSYPYKIGPSPCLYSNLRKFLDNWEVII